MIDYTRYEGHTEGLRIESGECVKIVDTNNGTVATMGFLAKPYQGPRRTSNEVLATANLFTDTPLILSALQESQAENATLRRELAMRERALRHRTCFSSRCDASECVEDSGGPDEQCAYRRELAQAAAQIAAKEDADGQD